MLAEKLLNPPSTGPTYIEDVFSTWVYAGSNTSQNIVNGIDLATKGGMTWIKCLDTAYDNILSDTNRGPAKFLSSNTTTAEIGNSQDLTAFNANGFSVGTNARVNNAAYNYVSWTFRKQHKFFQIVNWTGNGSSFQTISHALGSVPGFIATKAISVGGNWWCYHRSLGNNIGIRLNLTNAQTNVGVNVWDATSTTFQADSNLGLNDSGVTYEAYLYAHDAGGFGLTGTDNVISCGSCSTDGSGVATVNLGYEPQWLMVKRTDGAQNWWMGDVMRGMTATGDYQMLKANLSDAEATATNLRVSATGFSMNNAGIASQSFIYIAIRRGPMKVPTDGTKVFAPVARTGTNSTAVVDAGFPPDLFIDLNRTHDYFANNPWFDRLRGLVYLYSNSTNGEGDGSPFLTAYGQTGVTLTNSGLNSNATTYITYSMRRAPSFFDEVCYTGTGSATTFNHNLGAVPELMIVKERDSANPWRVYSAPTAATTYLALNTTAATTTSSAVWNDTTPTSSVFTVGTSTGVNGSGGTYVAYLFATCAGVSKVGSYTGTGATQTISCGFAGGARFVLIKRTDSTGDWYVWDTARGMVSGTDPSLSLNTTAAESNANSVYTIATGFQLLATPSADVNTSGGSYIFLAIA